MVGMAPGVSLARKKKRQSSLESFLDGSSVEPLTRPKQPRRNRDGSHFGICPICSKKMALYQLPVHASSCQGPASASLPSLSLDDDTEASANHDDAQSRHHEAKEIVYEDDVPAETSCLPENPLPGLYLYRDFVTLEEETRILTQLDGSDSAYQDEFLPWKPANFNGPHNGKRWGVHCNLRDRRVSAPENPMPSFFREILFSKLARLTPMHGCTPNEANAIDYRKSRGDFLSSHVDDRQLSKEPIANLSLAGECTMTFTNVSPQRNSAVPELRLLLPRRCLVVLIGRARYDFAHGILRADIHSERRVSVTMRESPLTAKQQQPDKSLVQAWWKSVSVPRGVPDSTYIRPTEEPIPGLYLFHEFITENEEAAIVQELDDLSLDPKWKCEQHSGRHAEKRFGVDHDLWSRERRPPKYELPNCVRSVLMPRLKNIAAMNGITINEVNAIDYRRRHGHSLNSHVDDRKKHMEPIANLSLAGDCYMTYTHSSKPRNVLPTTTQRVLLRRRCLQVMTGSARYDFAHGIKNEDLLSDRRVSMTMREILRSDSS